MGDLHDFPWQTVRKDKRRDMSHAFGLWDLDNHVVLSSFVVESKPHCAFWPLLVVFSSFHALAHEPGAQDQEEGAAYYGDGDRE